MGENDHHHHHDVTVQARGASEDVSRARAPPLHRRRRMSVQALRLLWGFIQTGGGSAGGELRDNPAARIKIAGQGSVDLAFAVGFQGL
ncbi:hypothetical protein chiPu_0008906 [Chiloscyllium punctatum]|uniref:Uncharacterized protein n=1 Tax=Chiloscyllium punctatum TaxID=137246 RepID=A0A401SJD8_CHIPU|nr:hypothetical protein [Chiloscyllium punctatum]